MTDNSLDITAPVLPESVADGVLLEWKKQAGEHAARDEVLVEVETDKIVLEVVAPQGGVLVEIIAAAGATVTGGEVLAKFMLGGGIGRQIRRVVGGRCGCRRRRQKSPPIPTRQPPKPPRHC